jgi:hypothetical protein
MVAAMSPTPEAKDTHTPQRLIRIPWDDWRDFKHAARAAPVPESRAGSLRQLDRSANIRAFVAWFLHRPGASEPDRPTRVDWEKAARTDKDKPSDLQRKVRIGNDWLDFEHAAAAVGSTRSTLVQEYIAWVLRRRGARLPERPSLDAWLGDAPALDDHHDLVHAAAAVGMTPEELQAAFIAWFLRRPAAALPDRPAVDDWFAAARGQTANTPGATA